MTARFCVGDRVQVLDLGKAGHVRIPFYVRGKIGEIIQFCGFFLNPEDLSLGNSAGPVIPLYRVSFRQTDLWPDYAGPPDDKLQIEIYDHWLAGAPAETVKRETKP
jgi:nitrile hydratase subunit beta